MAHETEKHDTPIPLTSEEQKHLKDILASGASLEEIAKSVRNK